MLLKISEIVSQSEFLKHWDGTQNLNIKNQNISLIQFHTSRTDSDINLMTIKNLKMYDTEAFLKVLTEGFRIKYRNLYIFVSKHSDHIEYISKLDNGNICGSAKIKNSGVINIISPFTNKDASEIINELFNGVELSSTNIVNNKMRNDISKENKENLVDQFDDLIKYEKKDEYNLQNSKNKVFNTKSNKNRIKLTIEEIIDSLEIN